MLTDEPPIISYFVGPWKRPYTRTMSDSTVGSCWCKCHGPYNEVFRNNLRYGKIRQKMCDHFAIILLCLFQRHCRRLVCAAHRPYILSLENVYSFKDISRHFKIGIYFVVKLNFGDSSSNYREK